MTIIITESVFEPWQVLQAHQSPNGQIGATSIFIGTMRDFNEGSDVHAMTLEHYPGMTEKQLSLLVSEARQRWQLIDTLIVHRVGDILPTEPIVLVAVWSSHRGDAFDASRYLMETLKSTAPFWKKERLSTDESRWLSHNSNGYQT